MNYLMHLYLADHCASSRVGNFLGDFVKGPLDKLPPALEPTVVEGIWLHRRIDSYSDQHEMLRHAASLLPQETRRVAPILVDLLFDHCLAKQWSSYCPQQALTDYTQAFYRELACYLQALDTQHSGISPRLAQQLPHMTQQDWLASYASEQGIMRAIHGVSQRLRRGDLMRAAMPAVSEQLADIEACFARFLPEVTLWSAQQVLAYRQHHATM